MAEKLGRKFVAGLKDVIEREDAVGAASGRAVTRDPRPLSGCLATSPIRPSSQTQAGGGTPASTSAAGLLSAQLSNGGPPTGRCESCGWREPSSGFAPPPPGDPTGEAPLCCVCARAPDDSEGLSTQSQGATQRLAEAERRARQTGSERPPSLSVEAPTSLCHVTGEHSPHGSALIPCPDYRRPSVHSLVPLPPALVRSHRRPALSLNSIPNAALSPFPAPALTPPRRLVSTAPRAARRSAARGHTPQLHPPQRRPWPHPATAPAAAPPASVPGNVPKSEQHTQNAGGTLQAGKYLPAVPPGCKMQPLHLNSD
ncbi:uncharacterized protein LOC132390904 [Hypanus sabinus]|uniref:uncharacterized protein LOC132390904 n=1 Tax=Hypanus sabinus TaxID=79690 RepID=UPI0028C3FFD0|nr:uncharacterized protein LOC132390904 [Hypanus sabinus]